MYNGNYIQTWGGMFVIFSQVEEPLNLATIITQQFIAKQQHWSSHRNLYTAQ